MENEFGYFSKDVALELEITTSTLRRWSIDLEKHGYVIERNDKDRRIYYERDFKALRELKKLIANAVPLSDAIQAIATRDFASENSGKTPSVYSEMIRLSKRELADIVKQAVEEERGMLLDELEERLHQTIEQRDRILTQQLRQYLAADSHQEEKISWWQRLFKREREVRQ
ncbi:MerR family transcriptional regulator [Sporosarcina sp. PTS2304]|uniref:MerR family transcriptional regulator n=1 Tax=Sporosarcina sp. PTS2304 TaxID=2283194 RepID=UPI001F07DF51|nr:MerR family transcriptional regulator [Sporosarcina sp. PTS2304]